MARTRIDLRWIIGLALASSVPASGYAQDETDAAREEVDTAAVAAELAQVFAALGQEPEFSEMIDSIVEPLLDSGEVQEGWSETGVDIYSELEQLPGGMAENVLYEADPEMPSVGGFDIGPVDLPDSLFSYPMRQNVAKPSELGFMVLQPGVILEIASTSERRGNAICSKPEINLALHSTVPIEELDEDSFFAIMAVYLMIERFSETEMCVVYFRQDDATFISRTFTSEGRQLEALDAESGVMRIRSVKEIPSLLRIEE